MRLISIFALIVLLAFSSIGPGCANIVPPAGGPRDSLPPILEKSSPHDSIRNFTGNKISFAFNEFVELQNTQENIVVSPLPKTFPTVEYKLNTVTVKLKDTLESNTTYHILFGDAIKDYNEGNVLKNFSYTFSTGDYIDSLELSGKVLLAESGKLDTTLIVMLHTSPVDSAVVKEKPRYIAKLDNNGNFVFKNLPPKKFYLYALKDEGGTRRYFRDNQLFAFASKPVIPSVKSDPLTLYAYVAKQATAIIPSLGTKAKGISTSDKRLKYSSNLTAGAQDLLTNFKFNFETPLQHFDSSKLQLLTDSTFTPVDKYKWVLDSTKKVMTLQTVWKENSIYHIILDKEFAADTSGRKLLKTDTINFRTKKLSDYGSLKLRFKNLDLTKNPVLLLWNGEQIYKAFPLSGNEVSESIFMPGEFELRILFDENRNGKWDPGEFFGKHKQPEVVKTLDRKISVKANFQNEFDINAE
jgi:hypothetical protein